MSEKTYLIRWSPKDESWSVVRVKVSETGKRNEKAYRWYRTLNEAAQFVIQALVGNGVQEITTAESDWRRVSTTADRMLKTVQKIVEDAVAKKEAAA